MPKADAITTMSRRPAAAPAAALSPHMRSAHVRLVQAVLAERPQPIPTLNPSPADLEERARHLRVLLGAVGTYVEAVFADGVDNTPLGIVRSPSVAAMADDLPIEVGRAVAERDGHYAKSLIADLAAESAGTLAAAADIWRAE